MKNSPLSILFATDVEYSPHLGVALFSLLQNNIGLQVRVIILTTELPKKDRYKLQDLCNKFEVPLEFIQLDDFWFDGLKLNHHFKKSNYYRLFAEDLIDDDKCLYLDSDIVVTGSISGLANTRLDGKYLAAVENPGVSHHKDLGMQLHSKYFNSEVMLLNLEKWRRENLKDRVISFVKENPEVIRFVDQCGLNGVVDGEWIELDKKYNCLTGMLSARSLNICHAPQLPVVVHYTGSSKPWHLNNKHPYKKLYWHYRNQTPYRSLFPDDFSLSNVARYIAPDSAKQLFKKLL